MSYWQKTNAGHAASGADWLDLHVEANHPEYEVGLWSVGIEPGWRVLVAACGAGNYLPWIVDIVGPEGSNTALDDAPENIEAVKEKQLAVGRLSDGAAS